MGVITVKVMPGLTLTNTAHGQYNHAKPFMTLPMKRYARPSTTKLVNWCEQPNTAPKLITFVLPYPRRYVYQPPPLSLNKHAQLIGHQVAAAPAVVGAVAAPALAGVVGAGPLDARFAKAQLQFGAAVALPAPGAFALGGAPVAGVPAHVIAKRAAESEPESEADADSEARDGKSLLLSRLGAGPVVGPAPVAVGPVVG